MVSQPSVSHVHGLCQPHFLLFFAKKQSRDTLQARTFSEYISASFSSCAGSLSTAIVLAGSVPFSVMTGGSADCSGSMTTESGVWLSSKFTRSKLLELTSNAMLLLTAGVSTLAGFWSYIGRGTAE